MTAKKQKTVVFVLDETGSMEVVRDATIDGFNSYIKELKGSKGAKRTTFNFVTFNSLKTNMRKTVPVKDAKKLTLETYVPSSTTPLYDAVANTIQSVKDGVDDVLFVIMTDGHENDSREFSFRDVVDMIKAKTDAGWSFVYLGANHDAWDVGVGLGIARANTVSYDPGSTRNVFDSVAKGSSAYMASASGEQTGKFFDDEDVKTFTSDPDYKSKMKDDDDGEA